MADAKKPHEKVLAGGVTQGEVDKWKTKYTGVHRLRIPKGNTQDDTWWTCYLSEPTRATISAASKFADSNPVKMNEILLENCWLGGDPEIKTDDKLFMSAGAKLALIFQIKEAQVEKL